eukprot:10801077-Lingulodinium_polyedra.AAC.1
MEPVAIILDRAIAFKGRAIKIGARGPTRKRPPCCLSCGARPRSWALRRPRWRRWPPPLFGCG